MSASTSTDTAPATKPTGAQNVQQLLVNHLHATGTTDSRTFSNEHGIEHQAVVGAMKALQSLNYVKSERHEEVTTSLTEEGKSIVSDGSHEAVVFEHIPQNGSISQTDLKRKSGNRFAVGFSRAMQNKWVATEKVDGVVHVRRAVDSVTDTVRDQLKTFETLDEVSLKDLKSRKLIVVTSFVFFTIRTGPEFSTTIVKPETELTAGMFASESWKTQTFKPYNFDAMGVKPTYGTLHPLLKVRAEIRSNFLEMGFQEMPTNQYVENGFWNFDALFQPQKHPARDAHDTFFVSDPSTSQNLPEDYLKRVQATHENGWETGSIGYQYEWTRGEAEKNILRTHTTAVSARMLHALASRPVFEPVKLFSIDKVFRNETLDATHLAEFFQVEGLVADRNLTLGHLIGVLQEFFERIGITDLKFKPAYNPYTEPSMEIFGYHPTLKKHVELGNSGVFRPEMLLPMGFPEDVTVIAWGLSLERPTMIKYGYGNIRELEGYGFDLKVSMDHPIVRLNETELAH